MSIYLERGPRSDDELYALTQVLWGYTIPRVKVCADHDAPFDAFATAFFNKEPQILIRGSRGLAGKSRLMAILGLTIAAVRGADVNILGGSLNQSNNIHETIRQALEYKNAPTYLVKDQSQSLIRLHNKAEIRPLTASQKTVRGPHPPILILDEIDEMDFEIMESAKGQPMPQKNYLGEVVPAQTIMGSTLQYPDKSMALEMKRFEEQDLPVFNWCHYESSNPIDGWLDPDFIEQKKREVSAERWRVEYDLGEPSIGNRAFDSEAVEKCFSLPTTTVKQKISKDYQEYQFEEYRFDREYVIAADWAKAQDFTVFTIYDCTNLPAKVVYWVKMRRRPYPVMIQHFNRLIKEYNAEAIHDATGLGGVVSDYLDIRAKGFLMTGEKRDNMLSEYINAVEDHKIKAPRISDFYKNTLYCVAEGSLVRTLRGEVPIEELEVGELVWTRKGLRPVTRVVCNGIKPLQRLVTSQGHELFTTPDHSIASREGWVRSDLLKMGDVALVVSADPAPSLTGFSDHEVFASVGVPVPTPISSLSGLPHAPLVLTGGDRLQVDGVDAGTIPTQVIDFHVRPRITPAEDEHPSMGQWCSSGLTVSSLRQTSVPDPATGLFRDGDPFEEVPHVLRFGETHVIESTSTGTQGKVYDITVEDAHEFFANGILVKNCSVEQIYSRGKEFHLPDEVCSMALAWHLVSRRVVASEPVAIKSSGKENYMGTNVDQGKETGGSWVGNAVNKTAMEEHDFNMMV